MAIIGIVLGVVAIGLIYWFKKDQQITNDLVNGDLQSHEHGMNALMNDFNNYQVETDRKIAELKKQLEIKSSNTNRRIDKGEKELPNIIRNVIGHIEFARPLDKR